MEPEREFARNGVFQQAWLYVERLVNALTTSAYNPFYYLGAISIFFLWIILVSGTYLFLFYSISAKGAYLSVQYLSDKQWYLGGVMRSLHRYASDGLVITMLLHAGRCFFLDRYKHWRWIAWVSGIAITWVVWIGGIFGYWMVWDEKARIVAELSARLIESVPIFGLPLSLNFASPDNLTDQLFYIILFIHFASIFFIFILILIHIMRITKAVINPPKPVMYGVGIVLLALSAVFPAASANPANLKALPYDVPFDWLYMFVFPLLEFMNERQAWGVIIALTLMGAAIPWLTRKKRNPAVAVTLENCTGCELCMEDCPYNAIQMRKRTDGLPYPLEAVVVNDRCASCGICIGACDYKALNFPDLTEDGVKAEIKRLALELKGSGTEKKVMVFACAKGAWLDGAHGGRIDGLDWARVVNFPCIGMLQPSMISIPFEKGLDGVFVAACRQGDCHFRTGNAWFEGRLSGHRPPVLKRSTDKTRLKAVYLSAVEREAFLKALKEFHSGLKGKGV